MNTNNKTNTKSTRRSFITSTSVIAGASLLMGQASQGQEASKEDAATKAFLQITLKVDAKNRPAAGGVYAKYRQPFLEKINGAKSKQLLLRDEDIQVLHGFSSLETAQAYLKSSLFTDDVVEALKPYLAAAPDVRIYEIA